MQDAVIVDAVRTPIGRHRGALCQVRPDDLLADTFKAAIERAGVDAADLDEVAAGCANQAGEDNRNVARMACLIAGFPYEVPALTVNRLCASGMDAVIHAVRSIWVGDAELVLAGGVESMTRAPFVIGKPDAAFGAGDRIAFDTSLGWRFPNPRLEKRIPLEGMGQTAENIQEAYGISREEQDAFALDSHRRAVAAWEAGRFDDEVIPVEIQQKKETVTVARDEGPRADTTLEKLGRLRPVFREGGTVTAGNSSSINDGACALLVASAGKAEQLGLEPLARVVGSASAGVEPRLMGLGPVSATRKLLAKTGVGMNDVDLVELNEAFAVQSLAVLKDLELTTERVNVNGGAIALGHPLGCSGARIITTLVHEMRRRQLSTGLASLCVGVGQGVSVLLRRDA
jgi:acetyl-CoA acyltransferase